MTNRVGRAPALRLTLWLQAGASVGMGLLLLAASESLGRAFGLPRELLGWVGLALLPFAVLLAGLGTRRQPARPLARAVVYGNLMWVLLIFLLLVSDLLRPSLIGKAFMIAQAGIAALFAWLEHRALSA